MYHEEVDTSMMLQAAHATHASHSNIIIHTVDTDVVVLAVALAHILEENDEVWMFFGVGNAYQFLAAHEMEQGLSLEIV